MVLIDSVKYACATCIKGHRSSTCNHDSRPLIEIKKKGRPVTQCVHCRELRKTKQVHVKCLCEGRPETGAAVPRTDVSRLVLPAAVAAAAPVSGATANSITSTRTGAPLAESSCDCKTLGGSCDCCTPKHAPRQQQQHAPVVGAGSGGAKPPGLTRGHTYHASSSSSNSLSMNHDAATTTAQRAVTSRHSGALQRSTSLHGAPGLGSSNASHSNPDGSHHPHPHHHSARHFAPYQVAAHHSHHHHPHFDLPPAGEEDATSEQLARSSVSATNANSAEEGAHRRHRSSSISYGDAARPFPPPAPMYLNGSAAMSLPDLAWGSVEINPLSSYPQQSSQQQQITGVSRSSSSSTFLPSSGPELDTFSGTSAVTENFIRQFGTSNNQVFDEPVSDGSVNTSDMQFYSSGVPEFRFAEVGLDQFDNNSSAYDYGDPALAYGGPGAAAASSDYDAMMASLLSLPQPAVPALGSGSGTVGSSGPPSMTGSITSRSSSRASGGLPSALEMLEMTSSSTAESGNVGVVGSDRGRPSRAFPIADPFENEATTAIPSFDAFDRPLHQQRHLNSLDLDKSLSVSHSHSPMSQDSVSSIQDDGNGTQFPAWPQHSPANPGSASTTSAYSPFDPDTFEFQTPAGAAALMYPGQRGPSMDFDDSAWNPRA